MANAPHQDAQAGLRSEALGAARADAFAQGYVDMMRAENEGMDNAAPRTPKSTGPTTFRHWVEEELEPAVLG